LDIRWRGDAARESEEEGGERLLVEAEDFRERQAWSRFEEEESKNGDGVHLSCWEERIQNVWWLFAGGCQPEMYAISALLMRSVSGLIVLLVV